MTAEASSSLAVGEAEQERRGLAAGGADLVEALPGDRGHRRAKRRCGAMAGWAASGAR